MKILLGLSMIAAVVTSCSTLDCKRCSKQLTVVKRTEVNWSYLNPKRKDKAPMAGTLWGDRKVDTATGYLLKPKDGFRSPPHIHNVSYRAVVIDGELHNDDPNATEMWMPVGSFWTQPKGEVHITAARGKSPLAYVEIESGPYLVLHEDKAFDSGERPVNVDPTNIVWMSPEENDCGDSKAKRTYLWGKLSRGELRGLFIKIPAGENVELEIEGTTFKAVVIKGQPSIKDRRGYEWELTPGSYFAVDGEYEMSVTSVMKEETILYVRTDDEIEIE